MPLQLDGLRAQATSSDGSRSDVFLHVVTTRSQIKGEATSPGHVDDIQVASWSWGLVVNTAIGSHETTARRSYKQLVVMKGVDAASTGLMTALATNVPVKEAVLTMRKAGGEALDYFTMTLGGARIVGLDVEVGTDGVPRERVAIAFTRIEVQYQRQQAGGGGGGGYSFSDELVPQV